MRPGGKQESPADPFRVGEVFACGGNTKTLKDLQIRNCNPRRGSWQAVGKPRPAGSSPATPTQAMLQRKSSRRVVVPGLLDLKGHTIEGHSP